MTSEQLSAFFATAGQLLKEREEDLDRSLAAVKLKWILLWSAFAAGFLALLLPKLVPLEVPLGLAIVCGLLFFYTVIGRAHTLWSFNTGKQSGKGQDHDSSTISASEAPASMGHPQSECPTWPGPPGAPATSGRRG
jgi:hypothetical protein